jgi:hypothetical protein
MANWMLSRVQPSAVHSFKTCSMSPSVTELSSTTFQVMATPSSPYLLTDRQDARRT